MGKLCATSELLLEMCCQYGCLDSLKKTETSRKRPIANRNEVQTEFERQDGSFCYAPHNDAQFVMKDVSYAFSSSFNDPL